MLSVIVNQTGKISNLMINNECVDSLRVSFDEAQKNIAFYYTTKSSKNIYNINQKEIPINKIIKFVLEFHKLDIKESIAFTDKKILIDGEVFK